MKTIFALLFTLSMTNSVIASPVICSLIEGDTRFKLTMEEEMIDDKEGIYIFITSTSVSATRRGHQSQGPVAGQVFMIDEGEETEESVEEYVLNKPIKGRSFSGSAFDLTKVTFLEQGDEDLAVKVEGPALSSQLTFINCLTAK